MTPPKNIILVGFMATGKSHVGRILSQRTGWPLVDADDEIVLRAGKAIQSIFDNEGEPAFRDLERTVIADLCAGSQQIISGGGGSFLDSSNRDAMLNNGMVFCLSATPDTILDRVQRDSGVGAPLRPLLAGDNPRRNIEELLAQRAEHYAQAHHTIDTDTLTPEETAERILELCGLKEVQEDN